MAVISLRQNMNFVLFIDNVDIIACHFRRRQCSAVGILWKDMIRLIAGLLAFSEHFEASRCQQ